MDFYLAGRARGSAGETGAFALLFGDPKNLAVGGYGTQVPGGNNDFFPIATIYNRAQSYAQGYYQTAPAGAYMTLIITTTNYGNGTTSGHGYEWAKLAWDTQNWINSPPSYGSKVAAVAGIDAEVSWSNAFVTKIWYSGYENAFFAGYNRRVYNLGDAQGCPFTFNSGTYQTGQTTTAGSCDNSWTQDDVRYVSWTSAPAFPFPQIYSTYAPVGNCISANAVQWERVARYHKLKTGGLLAIQGVLVQFKACNEIPNDPACVGGNNSPNAGYDQLWAALQYLDSGSVAQTPPWLSDVSWKN